MSFERALTSPDDMVLSTERALTLPDGIVMSSEKTLTSPDDTVMSTEIVLTLLEGIVMLPDSVLTSTDRIVMLFVEGHFLLERYIQFTVLFLNYFESCFFPGISAYNNKIDSRFFY